MTIDNLMTTITIIVAIMVGVLVFYPLANIELKNIKFCEDRNMKFSYSSGGYIKCITVNNYQVVEEERYCVERTWNGNIK